MPMFGNYRGLAKPYRCKVKNFDVKGAFNLRKELFTKGLSRILKKRMVKVLVWSVVLYGCEKRTLLQDEIKRLQTLEIWLWRVLEKISWRDKIRNDELLSMVNE